MRTPPRDARSALREAWHSWLNRPLSAWQCALGWLVASALFVALIQLLGGPSQSDAVESIYATWAFAHAHLACAYPPGNSGNTPYVAPFYPLISGALAALFRVGHSVAFPTTLQMGLHCSNAIGAVTTWSLRSRAVGPTLRIGYVGWLVLATGVVAVLRVTGRGLRGSEPTALFIAACAPPVLMCLGYVFHPQDLVAAGLILIGVASALRGRWIEAGVLLGLALMSQQFAALPLAAMLALVPRPQRLRFVCASFVTVAAVVIPLVLLTSLRSLRATLLGSSRLAVFGAKTIHSVGGTVLWETHLHGITLFVVSRVLPILLAFALARWAVHRFGPAVLEPSPLIALITISLALRLVFEVNLFGYYFMAVAIMLIVLDMVGEGLRASVVMWLSLVALAFNPVPFDQYTLHQAAPIAIAAVGLLIIASDALRRRVRWPLVAWLIFVILTCEPRIWGLSTGHEVLPHWFWQIVLVGSAIPLAAGPLMSLTALRRTRTAN
jgi:hypothetical protein